MFALLNPRFLIGLVIVAALAFSHFTAYRKGKHVVQTEWALSIAASNEEARRLERARQSKADDAGRLAASREAGIAAAVRRAAGERDGLRNDLAALRGRSQSCPAEAERTSAIGELLRQCAEAHQELAGRSDRHVNDIRLLLEAWPIN